MKKLVTRCLLLFILLALLTGAVACSGKPIEQAAGHDQDIDAQEPTGYVLGTPIVVDGVSFTVTSCEGAPVRGDRTQDNYAQENGDYFALGSEIVKAADYEQIVIDVVVENTTDKAITFSEVGWEAVLPDGYKLEFITVTGKIGEQLPSNYKANGQVIIIKEKAIAVDKLKLTYHFMDYGEEWQQAVWAIMAGEMSEKEYTSKFNPQPVTFELEL